MTQNSNDQKDGDDPQERLTLFGPFRTAVIRALDKHYKVRERRSCTAAMPAACVVPAGVLGAYSLSCIHLFQERTKHELKESIKRNMNRLIYSELYAKAMFARSYI
jgi:hypothetical protein